jgi:hypothetical protein
VRTTQADDPGRARAHRRPPTPMLFGDAKKSLESLVSEVKAL